MRQAGVCVATKPKRPTRKDGEGTYRSIQPFLSLGNVELKVWLPIWDETFEPFPKYVDLLHIPKHKATIQTCSNNSTKYIQLGNICNNHITTG